MYLTYEHRIEIPVEFTYVNQKKMIKNMEITYENHKKITEVAVSVDPLTGASVVRLDTPNAAVEVVGVRRGLLLYVTESI